MSEQQGGPAKGRAFSMKGKSFGDIASLMSEEPVTEEDRRLVGKARGGPAPAQGGAEEGPEDEGGPEGGREPQPPAAGRGEGTFGGMRTSAPSARLEGNPIPDWAQGCIPPSVKIPRGKHVFFFRFRAELTEIPDGKDRVCALWAIGWREQKVAVKRIPRGDSSLVLIEYAKQCIRAIDGHAADWSQGHHGEGSVERFWEEIGERCRDLVSDWYLKTHTLNEAERKDFFDNCCVVRRAV